MWYTEPSQPVSAGQSVAIWTAIAGSLREFSSPLAGQREEIRMRDALVGPRSFLIVLLALLVRSPGDGADRRHHQRDHQGRAGRRPARSDAHRSAMRKPASRERPSAKATGRTGWQGCQPGRYDLAAELAGFANAEVPRHHDHDRARAAARPARWACRRCRSR